MPTSPGLPDQKSVTAGSAPESVRRGAGGGEPTAGAALCSSGTTVAQTGAFDAEPIGDLADRNDDAAAEAEAGNVASVDELVGGAPIDAEDLGGRFDGIRRPERSDLGGQRSEPCRPRWRPRGWLNGLLLANKTHSPEDAVTHGVRYVEAITHGGERAPALLNRLAMITSAINELVAQGECDADQLDRHASWALRQAESLGDVDRESMTTWATHLQQWATDLRSRGPAPGDG